VDLNLRSGVLTDNPNALVFVPKSVCSVLKWVSGYPGKRSRQSEITLQAFVSGMGRLERKTMLATCEQLVQVIRRLPPGATASNLAGFSVERSGKQPNAAVD